MNRTAINLTLFAIGLVLAQAVLFNHVCLFGVAVPFVFIYVILRCPVTLSIPYVLTASFFIGLGVDIFSDTQGMNALSCTILGMMRKPVLRLYFPREDDLTDPEPSIKSLGMGVYMKYILSMSLIYCTLIFAIEAFTFFMPLRMILRIVFSTVLTTLLIAGLDSLAVKRHEKRL